MLVVWKSQQSFDIIMSSKFWIFRLVHILCWALFIGLGKRGNGRSLMVERQWLLFHVTFNDVQKINSISWEINYSDGNASRIQNFNVETKFIKLYIENTENKWTYNFIFGRNLLFLSFSRKMTVKWNIFNSSRIRCNVCCRKFSLHFTFSFLFFTFYLHFFSSHFTST